MKFITLTISHMGKQFRRTFNAADFAMIYSEDRLGYTRIVMRDGHHWSAVVPTWALLAVLEAKDMTVTEFGQPPEEPR